VSGDRLGENEFKKKTLGDVMANMTESQEQECMDVLTGNKPCPCGRPTNPHEEPCWKTCACGSPLLYSARHKGDGTECGPCRKARERDENPMQELLVEEETTMGIVDDVEAHHWEAKAMRELPAELVKSMFSILEREADLLSVEPFWNHLLAELQGSKGGYELEVVGCVQCRDQCDCDETSLPFPISAFQHAYELMQRLVLRGHEVKLHHVGDERFDGQILWVKA